MTLRKVGAGTSYRWHKEEVGASILMSRSALSGDSIALCAPAFMRIIDDEEMECR